MNRETKAFVAISLSVLALTGVIATTACAPAEFSSVTSNSRTAPAPTPAIALPPSESVVAVPADPSDCPLGGLNLLLGGKTLATVCNVVKGECEPNNGKPDDGGEDKGNNGNNGKHKGQNK